MVDEPMNEQITVLRILSLIPRDIGFSLALNDGIVRMEMRKSTANGELSCGQAFAMWEIERTDVNIIEYHIERLIAEIRTAELHNDEAPPKRGSRE